MKILSGIPTDRKNKILLLATLLIMSTACSIGNLPSASSIQSCGIEVVITCDENCKNSKQPNINLNISCESGKYSQSIDSSQHEDSMGIVFTEITGTRTYENTKNNYNIKGNTSFSEDNNGKISGKYHIEVNGGQIGATSIINEGDWKK